MNVHRPAASLLLFPFALALGCAQPANNAADSLQAAVAPPSADAPKAVDGKGVHNLVSYGDGLLCGSAPEAGGLQSLAAMGIKTVISVDGATPDVEAASRLGMRYVHLPIGYNGITDDRARELARAVANLPGPVYVHCHHGKHRSASALATAAVLAGRMSPEAAQERMKVSGTAADYQGLWACVLKAAPLPADQLRADPASFPAVAKVSGLVATMTEIDLVFDNVKVLQKAAWQVPTSHPDLVPAKETGRLRELWQHLGTDPESVAKPADYQQLRERSLLAVAALDTAVRAGDATAAEREFAALQKSCKECHRTFRDQ